jgi:hypothetical protein
MKSTQGINIPQDLQGYKKMEKQEEIDHRLLEDTPLVVRRHLKQSQPMHTMTWKNGFHWD